MLPRGYHNGSRLLTLVAVAIMTILSGPVQSSPQVKDPEEVVRRRVNGYFEAWRRGDYEAASGYVHPDSRKLYIYRIPRGAPIASYRIEKIACNPNKTVCEVKVMVARPNPFDPSEKGDAPTFPLENQWMVSSDGEWYLLVPFQEDTLQKQFGGEAKVAVAAKAIPSTAAPKAATAPSALPSRFQADPINPTSLHRGENGVFKFSYRNSGTAPIKITLVYADCDCTSVRGDHPLLAPGESGTLEVVVNTFGLPLGPISKLVSVAFSDLSAPLVIDLRIDNLANFTVTPESVDFGTLKKGSPAERTIQIVNQSGRKVKLLATSKTERQLTVRLDKTEVDPGEAVQVTLRCDPALTGDFMDILIVRADLAAEPLLNVAVRGRIIS